MNKRFFRNHQKISALILLLLATSFSGLAQKRFQVWTDFNARLELKNRFQINLEPGYRFELERDLQEAYFRTALRYSPSSLLEFDFGLANFNVWDSGIRSSFELRSFEFIFLNWPSIADLDFKIRMGFEQRWFSLPQLERREFLHRARIRFGVRSPYFDFWEGRAKLFVIANVEILGNVNDAVSDYLVDHSRYMAGLGFLDGRRLRLELHYQIIDLIDLAASQTERDKNLIRLRGYYYFNSR